MGTRTATLTAKEARTLTARIRDALALADDLLVKAYEGRVWEPLGYATWAAYCEAELPQLRMLKVEPEERAEKWAGQVRVGLSQGAIADAYGVGKATVSRALAGKDLPATATGLDGKVRSTRRSTVPPRNSSTPTAPVPAVPDQVSNVVRAVALVAAQGDRGLTVHELCAKTGWHHGSSSGALSKAHRRGLIVPSGRFRDRCRVYLRP